MDVESGMWYTRKYTGWEAGNVYPYKTTNYFTMKTAHYPVHPIREPELFLAFHEIKPTKTRNAVPT